MQKSSKPQELGKCSVKYMNRETGESLTENQARLVDFCFKIGVDLRITRNFVITDILVELGIDSFEECIMN